MDTHGAGGADPVQSPGAHASCVEAIRRARPPKLFLIADGARPDRPDEAGKCKAARDVVDKIDWPCETFRNYSDVNLGCGKRPASGISWVFEHVDRAIILEDDCLPEPSFFRYCDELLERHVDDRRVMQISGHNWAIRDAARTRYFFSLYGSCWGWATWRRAWKHFDYDMKVWPELARDGYCDQMTLHSKASQMWEGRFQETYGSGRQHIWDHQWTLACWLNGLTIVPTVPLISNIGWGNDATHTTRTESRWADTPTSEMAFPLRHPLYVARNVRADSRLEEFAFAPGLRTRARIKLYKLLGRKLEQDLISSSNFGSCASNEYLDS